MDIVEKLEALAARIDVPNMPVWALTDAALEIERLREENETLRGILRMIGECDPHWKSVRDALDSDDLDAALRDTNRQPSNPLDESNDK